MIQCIIVIVSYLHLCKEHFSVDMNHNVEMFISDRLFSISFLVSMVFKLTVINVF